MAPEGFPQPKASHYQSYKESTNSFVEWLATTARLHGYPSNLLLQRPEKAAKPPSTRLKGQDRKKAQEAAKQKAQGPSDERPDNAVLIKPTYVITIKDFIVLAEYIASVTKPRVKVPASVLGLLQRTITLRKRFAELFSQTSPEEQSESNAAHNYFIAVLQNVFDTLKTHCPEETPKPQTDPNHLTNIFANLEVESPSEDFLNAPSLEVKYPESQERFVAEPVKSSYEKYLAGHSVFMDLMDIRVFVRRIWMVYEESGCGLVPCCLATSFGVRLACQLQVDYEKDIGGPFEFEKLQNRLVTLMAKDIDISRVNSGGDNLSVEATNTLEVLMFNTYVFLVDMKEALPNNGLPIPNPADYGRYKPSRSQQSREEKALERHALLAEVYVDIMWLAQKNRGQPVAAEDDVIFMMRGIMDGESIEMWGVFATQLFVDIRHVLGQKCDQGFEELRRTAKWIRETLTDNVELHQHLSQMGLLSSENNRIQGMLDLIKSYVETDPVQETIKCMAAMKDIDGIMKLDESRCLSGEYSGLKETLAQQKSSQGEYSTVTLPPDFNLMKRYPLYCGLLTAYLLSLTRKVGTVISDACNSAFSLCHLHNALQKEQLLRNSWPDLDLLIKFQKHSHVFCGDAPTSVERYYSRWHLAMGVSALEFAQNKRERKGGPGRGRTSKNGSRRLLLDVTPLCDIFTTHWVERKVPKDERRLKELIDCVENHSLKTPVDEYIPMLLTIQRTLRTEVQIDELNPKQFRELCQAFCMAKPEECVPVSMPDVPDMLKSSTPLALLIKIFMRLTRETPALTFNYLRLHKRCWKVLCALKEELDADLSGYMGYPYGSPERTPMLVGHIFNYCRFLEWNKEGIKQDETLQPMREWLKRAAVVVDKHLANGEGAVELVSTLHTRGENIVCEESTIFTMVDWPDKPGKPSWLFAELLKVGQEYRTRNDRELLKGRDKGKKRGRPGLI